MLLILGLYLFNYSCTDFAGHSSYFENSSTMKQDIVEASDQKLPENSSAMKPDILEASGQKLAENSSAMKPDILEASDQKLTENSSAMKHDILEAPDQKFTDAEEVSSENEDKCDPMSTGLSPWQAGKLASYFHKPKK